MFKNPAMTRYGAGSTGRDSFMGINLTKVLDKPVWWESHFEQGSWIFLSKACSSFLCGVGDLAHFAGSECEECRQDASPEHCQAHLALERCRKVNPTPPHGTHAHSTGTMGSNSEVHLGTDVYLKTSLIKHYYRIVWGSSTKAVVFLSIPQDTWMNFHAYTDKAVMQVKV